MKKLILTAVSTILFFTSTACSISDNKSNSNDLLKTNTEEDIINIINDGGNVYKKSEITQPNGIGTVLGISYIPENDSIIIFASNGVCFTDSTFGVYRTFNFANEENADVVFEYADDKIIIVKNHHDYETESTSLNISVYERNGTLASNADIAVDEDFGAVINIEYIGDNKFLICNGEKCLAIDIDGNVIGELKSNDFISDIVRLADGRTAAIFFNKDKTLLREINTDTLEFGEFKLNISNNLNGKISSGIADNVILISGSSAVYGLKSDNNAHCLIDMTASGIMNVNSITPISENNFLAVENGKIVLLSEKDMSETAEIQEISLAVAGKYDSIEGFIADFNSQSNKYRIKVNDYSANYEYSLEGLNSAVNDLEMDIVSGKIPDMLWIEANKAEKLSSKGTFADLYEFMENDKTYSKDAFLPNFLQACETDGHLYTIQPSFMIQTMAAKKSYIDKRNWNIDEFIQTYESMPDGMELFEQGNNCDAVLLFITNFGMNFVDYSNFTCSFDSDEYIRMLEFANRFPRLEEYDFEVKSCRKDTALMSNLYIESFRDFNAKKYEIFGEDMAFVGTPTTNGNGSVIILGNQFAIMENSPNKNGCWEFIRTLFDKTQDGIPITQSEFEKEKQNAQERPFYIDDNGEKVYMDEIVHDWSANIEITVNPMTETDAEYYSDFVTSITTASAVRNGTVVGNIISEETAAYFADECSAEQCAEKIQNRVSNYLSEQS